MQVFFLFCFECVLLCLCVNWVISEVEVCEVQVLCYQVFVVEMGVCLMLCKGVLVGFDVDFFDVYCEYLLVCVSSEYGELGFVVGIY